MSDPLVSLELPWPPKEANPNFRGHWTASHRAKRLYRTDCMWFGKAKNLNRITHTGRWEIVLTFHPPDQRRRDDDNLIGSFKAGRDGLADALGIDDNRMTIRAHSVGKTVQGGSVVVDLYALHEDASCD